jgi:hypothetical protein
MICAAQMYKDERMNNVLDWQSHYRHFHTVAKWSSQRKLDIVE